MKRIDFAHFIDTSKTEPHFLHSPKIMILKNKGGDANEEILTTTKIYHST